MAVTAGRNLVQSPDDTMLKVVEDGGSRPRVSYCHPKHGLPIAT